MLKKSKKRPLSPKRSCLFLKTVESLQNLNCIYMKTLTLSGLFFCFSVVGFLWAVQKILTKALAGLS